MNTVRVRKELLTEIIDCIVDNRLDNDEADTYAFKLIYEEEVDRLIGEANLKTWQENTIKEVNAKQAAEKSKNEKLLAMLYSKYLREAAPGELLSFEKWKNSMME